MLKTFTPPKFERVDERGRFTEIIAEGTWRAVIHGRMNAGAVIGNHYHAVTRIFFYVTAGHADVDLVNVGTAERQRVILTDGKGIYLEPGTSHAIRFRVPTEFILLKSHPHDPSDSDTFPYPIDED